ncbi:MAG: ATP-binding protein, partial [Rubricella sp.]
PRILMSCQDITDVIVVENELRQAQKMEAVGQLTGGVAHDFNNLLTAIAGHCDLVLARQAPGGTDHADLLQIRQNTNRATALVRQLLSFSRKQTLQPRNLDLPHVLGDLTHLLNRLIGAKITLGIWHDEDLPTVMMDPRQFEQIVMNLVVNARDAMPGGGRIEIRADEREVTAPIEREGRIIAPGRYVGLVVTDTGTGIPPEIVERIFEPFFTTKGPGRGTGLGLSTVAGIVKQAGGNLFVTSTEGAGTRFEILLPAFDEPEEQAIAAPVHAPRVADPAAAGGHVLLVEDEASVRSFARRALELRGYRVTEAPTGSEALELLQEGLERPDIIVTDVMMPGLDGPEWIARQRAEGPVIPVLYISGYSEDVFGEAGLDSRAVGFLAKPFALNDLGAAVGELLAEPGVPIADQCAANPS